MATATGRIARSRGVCCRARDAAANVYVASSASQAEPRGAIVTDPWTASHDGNRDFGARGPLMPRHEECCTTPTAQPDRNFSGGVRWYLRSHWYSSLNSSTL